MFAFLKSTFITVECFSANISRLTFVGFTEFKVHYIVNKPLDRNKFYNDVSGIS